MRTFAQGGSVVLASASPRRAELLSQIGIDFTAQLADIDETWQPAESPSDYVERMAWEKSQQGWAQKVIDGGLVIGADTVVVLKQDIIGKPAGRHHRWHTNRAAAQRDPCHDAANNGRGSRGLLAQRRTGR